MSETSQETIANCLTIIGPSQIGKTSLISAIYEEIKKGLEGTQVSFTTSDQQTTERLNRFNDKTLSTLRNGRVLNATEIANTEEFSTLKFELRCGNVNIPYEIVDYPGGWLGGSDVRWTEVRQAVRRSQILVVITDATLIMEANTDERKSHVEPLLHISAVKETVEEWAKATYGTQDLYLFLIPVKCETYEQRKNIDVNNKIDLMNKTNDLYKEIKEVANKNNPSITFLYQPVQTLGGVALIRVSWKGKDKDKFQYAPSFKVFDRDRNVSGCKPILSAMCKTLATEMNNYQNLLQNAIHDLESRPIWEKILGEIKELIESKTPIKLPIDVKGPNEIKKLKSQLDKIADSIINLNTQK